MKKMLLKCHSKAVTTLARVALLIVAAAFLAGCGSKLSGTYKVDSNGGIPVEKMNFTSGSKVELTYVGDKIIEASYVVEGDQLKVSAAGMTQVWMIEKDGSLNGGETIGRFVKQ
jgi:hypothetical protein